jgi:transcriptional regulator with XRE-family HTH domain
MPKTKTLMYSNEEPFGAKLARFRQAAGYSQRDLARETGISQRMIAYYEKQPQYPPMHVMTILSEALGIPPHELLKSEKPTDTLEDVRLRRRLKQIEELEEEEKRRVIQLLDTFIEKYRLKQQVMGE